MTTDPDLNTPKEEALLNLLIKERGYYRAILDIALEENSRLLAHCPLGELQPLVRQKRIILLCIQSIDRTLEPLKKYWQSKKDRSDPLSTKILEEISSLNLLLGDIIEVDKESQGFAEKHLQGLRGGVEGDQ